MADADDSFTAGLVSRRQALAERKERVMPQLESVFDDGLPDDDDVVTSEEEEGAAPPSAEEEEPPTAAATPQAKVTQRKRGKGRKNRAPAIAVEPMVTPAAASAPAEDLPEALPEVEGGINPRDPLIYWPKILAAARTKGFGPEYLQIRIERAGIGASPTPFILIDTVQGDMVAGSETENPGQSLVDYLTDVVHLGRKTPGRAKYKLQAFYKIHQTGGFPVMTLELDHPDEIRAQQMRRAQYFREREVPSMQPLGMGAPPYRVPQAMGHPPYLSQAPASLPPPPMPVSQGSLAETLAQLRAYEEWRQVTIAAGQPAPPPAPQIIMPAPQAPPAPVSVGPRLTKEEEDLIFEGKMARFVEKAGYVKPGVGSPPPSTAVVAAAANPVAAMKDLFKMFAEIKSMEKQVGTLFGYEAKEPGEEEPEEKAPEDKVTVLQIPGVGISGRPIMLPRNTKGTIDFFQQAVMSNLETSQELAVKAVGGIAGVLDKTSFGKLLESLASKGGQPAQIAAAAKASGMVGTGAVNGAAPLPQRPRGPMA